MSTATIIPFTPRQPEEEPSGGGLRLALEQSMLIRLTHTNAEAY
jgi:hypothetical protein